MGRGRGRGRGGRGPPRVQKRDFGKSGARENTWTDYRGTRASHENVEERKNPDFEAYYKEQGVCPEEEWDAMIETLKKPLPITFRINGTGQFANELRTRLEQDFFKEFTEDSFMLDGEECQPPRPMKWYPNNLAWHMHFSRAQLRKLPMLEALHEFMKRETETGSITRQEAVSMVPPLFLDVQPHHNVLDMCAAPGSKTFQLLEMLHAGPAAATGLVVANDADAQRCNLLTHQTKRMCSPCLLVTNHDGQLFPLVRPATRAKRELHGAVQYDRILCDVPCSGDGTMRKAPDIWRRWTAHNGNGLHPLQVKITLQACKLLKVGGRLVYSTCTFNPIEDEAVVATILRCTKGAMRLVDARGTLPALKRVPGMRTWKVKDRHGWYSSWEDAEEDVKIKGARLDPTMFPDAESKEMPLEYTMRFLPHHQDTGGFYVAVLEKVADCSDMIIPDQRHRANRRKAEAEAAVQAKGAKKAEATTSVAQPAGDAKPSEDAAKTPSDTKLSEDAAPAVVAKTEDTETSAEAQAPAEAKAEAPAENAGAAAAEARKASKKEGLKDEGAEEDSKDTELKWEVRGGGGRGREGSRGRCRGLDPIIPITDEALLGPVVDFYGIESSFPLRTHIITRSQESRERPKRLYYVSDAVRHLLMMDENESLKVTSTGLKLLERQEVKDGSNPCIFRVSQEGLPFLLPHIRKQRVKLHLDEFLAILEKRCLRLPKSVPYTTVRPPVAAEPAAEDGTAEDGAEEGKEAAPAKARPEGGFGQEAAETMLIENEATLEQLAGVCAGCCIATLTDEDNNTLGLPIEQEDKGGCLTSESPLAISCWRTKATLNVLVSKVECAQMIEKIKQAQAKTQAGGEEPDSKKQRTA